MAIKLKIHPPSIMLISKMLVTTNSDRHPAVDYTLSFPNQKLSRVYSEAALFGVKFFGMDEFIIDKPIQHTT